MCFRNEGETMRDKNWRLHFFAGLTIFFLFVSAVRAEQTLASNDWIDLGTLGGTKSLAHGISADGRVVVGESTDTSGSSHAFGWTEAGMIDLGNLPGGKHAVARGVSADGSVVVGHTTDA